MRINNKFDVGFPESKCNFIVSYENKTQKYLFKYCENSVT